MSIPKVQIQALINPLAISMNISPMVTVPNFGSSMAAGLELLNIFTWITKIFTVFSTVVSVPLYILVLYTVVKKRKRSPFNSKYFTIYVALGVVDIMSYLYYIIKKCPYWDVDLPIFKPYDQHNVYMQILYFNIWWFAFAQYQLTIFISFNRFVSITLSQWYQKYWTERATLIVLVIIFVECACLASPIFNTKITVATTYMNFGDGNITRRSGPVFGGDPAYGASFNMAWKVHVYTIIACCFIFYPIMFWKIRHTKVVKNSKLKSEIKLMYSALVLFLANLLYAAFFVFRDTMIAQYKEFGRYSEWALFLLADIYDLHNAYALICTSKEVRKAVWKTIIRSNEDSTMMITAFSVSNKPGNLNSNSNASNVVVKNE